MKTIIFKAIFCTVLLGLSAKGAFAQSPVGRWNCHTGSGTSEGDLYERWSFFPNGTLNITGLVGKDGTEWEQGYWSMQGELIITQFNTPSTICFKDGPCVQGSVRPIWTFRISDTHMVLTRGSVNCDRIYL